MKLQLRWIPTEVWVDVFRYPGKSRKELGQIADKLGRKFAEYLQFYLHEWGKRTLEMLFLNKKGILPRTPMPENIKFFGWIMIRHFDSSTIDFLRQINTLFTGVNLSFSLWTNNDLTKLRTILDHLAPLLHVIHSLKLGQHDIPLVEQHFTDKLAEVKMLTIPFGFDQPDPATLQASINFCLNWLTSEQRDTAEARFLKVYFSSKIFQQFIMVVQQQFQSAKRQCTFAIKFEFCGLADPGANFHLENDLGEHVDGQLDQYGDFQIFRYYKQVDFAREQLQDWVRETVEKSDKSNVIELYRTATIGQFDGNASANEVNDNGGEEEEDGPSTSKKLKLR